MQFIDTLHQELEKFHLLNHPFYKLWSDGALDIAILQTYAIEYYHHVAAFPRYISAIHSQCNNIKIRQVLLDNLVDEEKGHDNHPELWQRFGDGIGVDRNQYDYDQVCHNHTKELVEGYFNLTKSDFAIGLGALYAYERQTPEVSKSKIEGLKKHYSINESRALQFFDVHMAADEWHRQECENIIVSLSTTEQQKVMDGALAGAKLLWSFLDGLLEKACNKSTNMAYRGLSRILVHS